MKRITLCCLIAALGLTSTLHAAQIEKVVDDHRAGQSLGGVTGVMLGGIAGPLGALAGGLAGIWLGGIAQETAGLSQRAYVVRNDEGKVRTIRAPYQTFSTGEQVTLKHGRIHESRH